MRAAFETLRERLLAGGVATRHVRRYVAELQDHLDDLVADELANGAQPEEARARATARLGDIEALAGAMTSRREFRTLSARAPAVAYALAPLVGLLLATALTMGGVILWVNILKAGAFGGDLPTWTSPVVENIVGFVNAALAVLAGWALAAGAAARRAPPPWPILGFVLLAAMGAAVQVDLTLPSHGAPGELEISGGLGRALLSPQGFAPRFVIDLALMLAAYAALSVWRSERALLRAAAS